MRYKLRTLLIVPATVCFLTGLFLNNTTFATNDYTTIVSFAGVAFGITLALASLLWLGQPLSVRLWSALMACVSVIQLFDVARRLF